MAALTGARKESSENPSSARAKGRRGEGDVEEQGTLLLAVNKRVVRKHGRRSRSAGRHGLPATALTDPRHTPRHSIAREVSVIAALCPLRRRSAAKHLLYPYTSSLARRPPDEDAFMTALATASNAPRRYIAVGAIALFAVIAAHLLLTLTNYRYRALAVRFGLSPDGLFLQNVLYEQPAAIYTNFSAPDDARANATFVVLARNSEAKGVEQSIRDIEARFNAQYQYPYVFLNDEEFTDEFKARVLALTDAPVEFGLIPSEHWNQPDWIDEERALESRKKMKHDGVMYGGSLSYRNMCRFNSGFFYRHPLMLKYRYYWRIEPDVHFHCDINFDPFLFMQENKKVYGETSRYSAPNT